MHKQDQSIDMDADALLGQMTLQEKVALLGGQDFWSLPAIERLGVRSLVMADGPTGLRSSNSDPATVFPVAVALAATWNCDLVRRVASAMGREARAHGVDVLLAPGVNIQRTPLGGRNFEYYSEDPHLSSETGIAFVEGVQAEGVGASVKHYAANNQEHMRMTGSSNVGERVLREIYLAAFETIIKRARPWTVMSAYNRVNGVFASEHDALLNGVLKGEWGFDGVVVSDWGAANSTIGSATGGLDLEMPGPPRFYGEALLRAVEEGDVPIEDVDEHVRRVLRLIIRCGCIGEAAPQAQGWAPSEQHRALSRSAAGEAMVLLKNEGNRLPLSAGGSIAVIGALADYPAIQGAGSSQVSPDRIVSPLSGLRAALQECADVRFERGVDPEPRPPVVDGRLLSPCEGGNEIGLRARYFDKPGYAGEAVYEDVDWRFAKLGFGAVAQTDDDLGFSVEWTGVFTPRHSGVHEWLITHSNPDAELVIGEETLVGEGTHRESEMLFMILPLNRRRASIRLEAGKSYPITIRFSQPGEHALRAFNIFNVCLREPAPDRAAAIYAAGTSDAAIVFVGSGTTSETEGEDRASMRLSDEQNALVEAIADVNENTIVVVNTGGPIEMPWADRVPAIVQMWLPGQEGGDAIADVLTGKINPSGKLPVTMPVRYEDNPTFLHYPGGQDVDYGEGLFVGYRYYDAVDAAPLFPFGHGLSYTQFSYGPCMAPATVRRGEMMEFELDISNTGAASGAETVQVYVEDLATQETKPLRQLRAFEKVFLEPNASQRVRFALDERAFAWWDRAREAWTVTPGRYRVHAGASSRDLRRFFDLEIVE